MFFLSPKIFKLILCISALLPLQAAPLTSKEWTQFITELHKSEESLKASQGDKFRQELKKNLRKNVASAIKNNDDTEKTEELADISIFLEPIINALDNPQKAGQLLEKSLFLKEGTIGALNSISQITSLEKEIRQTVQWNKLKQFASHYNYEALERSINHLATKYPDQYKNASAHLARLASYKKEFPLIEEWLQKSTPQDNPKIKELVDFRLNALLNENPEVTFQDYLSVRRFNAQGNKTNRHQDRPANWQGITSMPGDGARYQSEVISSPIKNATTTTRQKLFTNDRWVGHLDLDFSGEKLLFTTNEFDKNSKRPWDVSELNISDKKITPVTKTMPHDTDSYDSCYLPDGRIIFINTSGFQGVPCVGGVDYVGNIHLLNRETGHVRRLTLDQDNNWFPTLLEDGRVMYLRWEYTESAHYFSRILMHMNPDGSDQKEYYGSNSYWPNSLFNAKAIPNKPGMFVGIVSGHHGENRVGELIIFDINKGRVETEGAVQKIPGFGKPVENITKDELVNGISTPYFAEPYPLSENYFLASCNIQHHETSMNIVFCDTFDNIIPLTASQFFIYAEPRPLQSRKTPPVIPDRVKLDSQTAVAYITDANLGRAMKGIPKGTAKALRVFMSEYSPRNEGSHYAMGMESNWDVKVLYGTTPILKDGSAMVEIPANQPITVQVLDENGRALSLMRSWFTAMPGEVLSCIGCHENQNEAPPAKMTLGARQKPAKLTPWYGAARTFSFLNEIQPVLDKNCISCHNPNNKDIPDFATTTSAQGTPGPGSISYYALHPFVRRNGPEGDYRGLMPTEFFVDTSELYQLLKKGHHEVTLNAEEWDRLQTWMDMNVPYLGNWKGPRNDKNMERRYELHNMFTTIKRDYTTMDDSKYTPPAPKTSTTTEKTPEKISPKKDTTPSIKGFPFVVNKEPARQEIDLGNNVKMALRQIPAGNFIMGSNKETPQEKPAHAISIKKPYWMGETEVTLAQYKAFDPSYKNGFYDMHYKDQVKPGYDMDTDPQLPVIRVSWQKALEFCQWLSQKTGKKVTLPTEAQWEFAARAGANTALPFGELGTDFSPHANLADVNIKKLAVSGVNPQPINNPDRFYDFVPRDEIANDGVLHLAPVGKYKANTFGLYDMIGNVAEWTRSIYRPYPWKNTKSVNGKLTDKEVPRVVRGGSWRDRPKYATSSWRWGYPGWRRVYNVGFRVIIED